MVINCIPHNKVSCLSLVIKRVAVKASEFTSGKFSSFLNFF